MELFLVPFKGIQVENETQKMICSPNIHIEQIFKYLAWVELEHPSSRFNTIILLCTGL